ncbi:lysophospholipase/glycerophospholipid:cholesterol acyltransferase PlaC [Legionella dresdenensis]|uniref:Lysophospholipase/glycerophospholipid:cholestero l acyltransferase PlaC n=1 Tax=Legionella dresdenensis TaxID=450200 RepID=A0ABV8CHI4_9GAMM
MTYHTRMCAVLCFIVFFIPLTLTAAIPVKSMVIFGDSLSDNGNVNHLLKSLRKDESPAYLVYPFKVFVINKMHDFAAAYHVPQTVLDSGIKVVNHFFDQDLGPLLATLISKVRSVPVIPADPYWQAHFSNGRIWNEYLAPMLGVDREDQRFYYNQAFGGSWAVTYDYQLTVWNLIRHPINTLKTLVVGKLIPPSLGMTVQAYLLVNPKLDPETVYFVFSGANDYVNVLKFEDNYNPAIMSRYVDNVLDGLEAATHRLIQAGAQHVIVLGLPEIGYTPKFVYTTDKDVLNSAVALHNQRLEKRVGDWQRTMPAVDFLYIDMQQFVRNALQNPADYGFRNVSNACIDVKLTSFQPIANSPFAGNYVLHYAQLLRYRDPDFAPDEKNYHVCDNQEDYLFWDEIHPSTRAHNYLAYEICQTMKQHGYQADCQMPGSA